MSRDYFGQRPQMTRGRPELPTPEGVGLGDIVAKVTKATGLDKVARAISRATGKDCGCNKRRESLNRHRIHGRK